jgi:hypothetical protein
MKYRQHGKVNTEPGLTINCNGDHKMRIKAPRKIKDNRRI